MSSNHPDRFTSDLSSYLQEVANGPTLGLYQVQQHIFKVVPRMVASQGEFLAIAKSLHDESIDARAALEIVQDMNSASKSDFAHIRRRLETTLGMIASQQ
eukprot:TRINITY_DN17169_c0_g1_i1.p1 TRINITY_DN17169_c0_g1~~TRINITY_DN17169_c0_g1_i1.p1  ORF type:complete len:100 (+),score=5.88 TRINITY_DN17169_c0_g1_i1:77-376(+)